MVGFTYDQVPAISQLNPASGPKAGGTRIIISGTGFLSGATVEISQGAGQPQLQATVVATVSSTQIRASTPPGIVGTFNVFVTDAGGTSRADSNVTYTYTSS